MQSININVTKIDKTAIFEGKNGKYLSLVLHENKQGPDQYGNDGFVTQDLGRERRLAGERGPILGNWKHLATRQDVRDWKDAVKQPQQPAQAQVDFDADDDIPF